MAGNIKGITIEFAGDTSKLDKALRDVSKSARAIDKELRAVDKALKFNPTSVDLWRQKQTLLKQKISETERSLDLLKQKQAAMDAAGVDKNSAKYRELQREIIETESKLKTFKNQLKSIGNVNLQAASAQVKEFGNKLTSAGQALRGVSMAAGVATAAIGALTVKSAKAADDINTMSKKYSIGTKELQMYSAAAELVDVDVETIAKSHVKLEKTMLSASKGTGTAADAFKALGVDVTNADGSLRDGDTVWQETIKALGSMTNETERDAYAMALMGRSAAELNPLIEDGGEAYTRLAETMKKYGLDFIDQETLDKANQFNDELDTIKSIGTIAFQTIGSELAAYLAPALEKVVGWVGQFASWLSQLDPKLLTIIAAITGVVAVLAPLLIGAGKIAFAISSIMSLMATLGPAIAGIVAALGPVILIIGAVVAAGILLYKNWDKIKAKAIEIKNNIVTAWNNIKTSVINAVNSLKTALSSAWSAIKSTASSAWNAVKTAITKPINSAVSLVRAGINKLKSIVNGAKLKLPHIKLPHFSISGKLSLNPPSIPKVSVSWYKTGGIFDSPTIAGIGEAGPEAVVPLDTLWKKLDNIAAASAGADGVTINVYATPYQSPKEIAVEVEKILANMQKRRNAAYGGI